MRTANYKETARDILISIKKSSAEEAKNIENNELEFKSSCISSVKMKNELVKSVVGFLNSNDGGLLMVGVSDDANLLGIEKTEEKFSSLDDYEQLVNQHLRSNIRDGAERLRQHIRVFSLNQEGKTVLCVRVNPFVPKNGQIVSFGTYQNPENRGDKREKCYLRTGNHTSELNDVEIASFAVNRMEGEIKNRSEFIKDTQGQNVFTSPNFVLTEVLPDSTSPHGKPALEIKLSDGNKSLSKYRLKKFNNHEQIVKKAYSLIGKEVRTFTWEDKKSEDKKRFEKQGYFENLYPILKDQRFEE